MESGTSLHKPTRISKKGNLHLRAALYMPALASSQREPNIHGFYLRRIAGGLKPTKKGGGMQTKSLRLEAPDGRRFRVRSVDKDPTPTLPPDLRGTFAEWVVQDQISAAHPAGPMIVDGLADAGGRATVLDIVLVRHRLPPPLRPG